MTETKPGATVKNSKNIDKNNVVTTAAVHTLDELNADLEQLAAIATGKNLSAVDADGAVIENDGVDTAQDGTAVEDNAAADMPVQEANSAIEVDGNVFFTDDADSTFTEPSASSPKDATPLQRALGEMYGNPVLTEDQKTIKSIGKKLGWKILFDNVYVKDAQGNKVLDKMNRPIRANADIDFKNRTITIDFNCKKPIQFLFKHELTHFGETSELYQDFVDNIRVSSVYLQWLQAKTGNNVNSVGKLEGVYRDMVIESRKSVAPVGFAEAQQEMYADFCGDVLFSNNQNALNRLMDSLDKKERPKFIQFILDFITYLKEKIAGNKQITLELVKLENQFAKMLNDAKENTDQTGGVKYSAEISRVVKKAIENKGNIEEKFNQKKISPVPNVLAQMVFAASGGEIDITNKHIAVNGSDIYHEYINHSNENIEKYRLQIPLTQSDIVEIISAIYEPDIIEGLFNDIDNPKRRKSFAYAKKKDGYYIVAEAVGGKKNPNIVPVMMLHVTEAKWNRYIDAGKTIGEMLYENNPDMLNALDISKNKKNRVIAAQFASKEAIANTPHSPQFESMITQNDNVVNKYSVSADNAKPDTNQHRDIPAEMQRLIQQKESGEIDADTFTEQMNALYAEANERYGVIPQGENAATPISVPQKVAENKVTKRFVRTILETGKLDAEMIEGIEQEVLLGIEFKYKKAVTLLGYSFFDICLTIWIFSWFLRGISQPT